MTERIRGYCPMGCGETLFVGSGGFITCSYVACPCPDAVSTILDDSETEHIVELDRESFSVQHPLRERLNGDLFRCKLHGEISDMDGPPRVTGRYRVYGPAVNRHWEHAPVVADTPEQEQR